MARSSLQSHEATAAGQLRGKLAYMPPEQIAGESIDRRVDVFALGCLEQLLDAPGKFEHSVRPAFTHVSGPEVAVAGENFGVQVGAFVITHHLPG